MSIPPLVCSTPPPPDQCEDDKDHEDFDIQYNLSQDEDDEENYDFGSFATYNHFQSAKNKVNDPGIPKVTATNKITDSQQEQQINVEPDLGTNTSENKERLEEEVIEDLDLKLNDETLESAESTEVKEDNPNIDADQEVLTESELQENTSNINTDLMPTNEFDIETPSVEEPLSYVDEIIAAVDELQLSGEAEQLPEIENTEINQEIETTETVAPIKQIPATDVDDDFGDFDDFQFASSIVKPATVIDNCDNPWDSNTVTDDGFGDFKASFDDNASNMIKSEITDEHSIDTYKLEAKVEVTDKQDDDDFGDFDDFQSSAGPHRYSFSEETAAERNVPVLNLPTDNETQLMESINKVIFAVFVDEIPEVKEEFDKKLDSMLGETWGYLLQVDERQPYMVNWNNSLGQKTLLKALCIDSRNILFGPKWNYSMPKYAANLTAAPLQPQKQATMSSPTEVVNPEKTSIKPAGTWSDPFTSEGQDSCNPDPATENSVIEAGPTDLDVFEASTSSKPDKIYSSTINVQPIRQINLPDTHIFTPTDSQTPRSTTIHYDNSPSVLLPQTALETSKSEPNFKTVAEPYADNDEYWEFQDFKGTPSTLTTSMSTATEKGEITKSSPNVTYGTQVLQPMKIEPIVPTLNWPDPGEVKETFDDFSEFVSNSVISNQQQTIAPVQSDIKANNQTELGISNTVVPNEKTANNAGDNFDDDFDTFQSALPPSNTIDINFTSISNVVSTAPQVASQSTTDFDFAFPKMNNIKSETISIDSKAKIKDTFVQNHSPFFPNSFESSKSAADFVAQGSPIQISSTSVTSASLLQPTTANSMSTAQNQQKSTQILQPLSLESYSQINWPNPGIDLQDLSRFNPVETLHSLKTDLSVNSQSKIASPSHNQKGVVNSQATDDDIWGEFVSSKPKPAQQAMPKKQTTLADDDEWTDFVSNPNVKPQNGLNTISFNVHTNSNIQKANSNVKRNQVPLDIPTLNYITPKSSSQKVFNDRHFQNL